MKKLLLLTCAIFCISSARSQNVANTYWLGYDQTNTSDIYWHFATDTLSFTVVLPNFSPISTFTETMSQVNVTDIPDTSSGFCGSTGTYNKVFSGDTMWLNLVSDPCTSRVAYITTHYFISQPLGIAPRVTANDVRIAPNPTLGIFTVNTGVPASMIMVSDIAGRTITQQNSNSTSVSIDLGNEPAGIYFVTILFSDGKTTTQRIVRE